MSRRFWVVFNNDMALSVALSLEQAQRETAKRKELHAQHLAKAYGSAGAVKELERSYFHHHEVPGAAVPLVELPKEDRDALEAVGETDGAEMHSGHWDVCGRLEDRGLVTMSAPRGPGRGWRRVELTELGREVLRG